MNALLRYHKLPALLAFLVVALICIVPFISLAQAPTPDPAAWYEGGIAGILWRLVNSFFGWLVGVAGVMLDFAINKYLVGFGDTFLSSGVGVAVDNLWVQVRDLFNITFIFGLVFIGFKMILNSDDANTRRWLVNLIMAALLVNFSLFITKFIVDFSNLAAYEMAQAWPSAATPGNVDVSTPFMDLMGINNVWDAHSPSLVSNGGIDAYGYIFGTMIVFLISAFVFAAGAIMLMIRFVALNLYMILSPFMFIGWVFPSMMGITRTYWSGFLGRAFFAPIYILMLYFSFRVLEGLRVSSGLGNSNFAAAMGGQGAPTVASIEGTIPIFLVACMFMLGSIVVGQRLGADGASTAIKVGQNIRGRVQRGVGYAAGGATAGLAARGLRNSAGYAANSYAESDNAKRRASSSWLGKQAYNASRAVAGSSFDARQVGGIGKATGLGTGTTGGFAKIMSDDKKAREKLLKDLGEEDTSTAENQAKIALREAEIKKLKEAEKAAKQGELENRKAEQAEAQKPTALLTTEISTLSTSIEAMKQELAREAALPAAAKTLSVTAVEAKQAELSTREKSLTQKKAALTVAQRKDPIRTAINDIERQEMIANASGDVAGVQKARAERTKREAELRSIDASMDLSVKTLESEVAEIGKEMADAKKMAEAEIKFGRQINYMKQLQTTQNMWNTWTAKGGNAATGLGLGAAGGSLAGAAGAATGGLVVAPLLLWGAKANSARRQADIDAINKEYIKGGAKRIKNDQRKKDAKLITDAAKDASDDSDEAPKKEDAA